MQGRGAEPPNSDLATHHRPGIFQRFRRQLERGVWLNTSNYGRAGDWEIELDGRVVGRLTSPEFADMFWLAYTLTDAAPELLNSTELWHHCKLRFRCAGTHDYASNALASIGENGPQANSIVYMRRLLLASHGRVERFGYDYPHLARRLLRLLPDI